MSKQLDLKQRIRIMLQDRILENTRVLDETRRQLLTLGVTDVHNAKYRVTIDSNWDKEEDIVREYRGTLVNAVKLAEDDFRELNKCDIIDAVYHVELHLASGYVGIPEEYWKKYLSRKGDH